MTMDDDDEDETANNEIEERKAYDTAVEQFLSSNPSVNRSHLLRLLEKHNDAATAGLIDDARARWDFSGSFHFVTTIVTTIGKRHSTVSTVQSCGPAKAEKCIIITRIYSGACRSCSGICVSQTKRVYSQ